MKKTIVLFSLAIWLVFMPLSLAARTERLLGELAGMNGVESVYIGKAGLRFAGNAVLSAGEVGDVGSWFSDMESIEIINCEKSSVVPQLVKKAKAIIDRLNLEIIVETRDGDETTRIYGIVPQGTDAAVLKSLLIENREPGEYSLVYIRGTVDISRLEDIK